jgi:flagellar motor protein MotB
MKQRYAMKTRRCDKKNTLPAGRCRSWAAAVLTAGVLFFCLSGICTADSLTPVSQKHQDLIHYQARVTFITEQVQQIQSDMDWLALKIRRMEDFDRFVPQRMHDSIAFKQSKIASLEKLKKRYQDLIPPLEKLQISAEKFPRSDAFEKRGETPAAAYSLFPDKTAPGKTATPSNHFQFQKNLEKQMAAEGLDSWLELVPHTTPVRMETRLPILFASASADIPKGYDPFLKNLAGLVKGYDVRIVVDGYADTDPIDTAAYPSNFELGAARAAAVVRALAGYGIRPQVCKIGSTGQYRFDAKKQTEWKNLQRHATIAVFFNPGI